MQRRHWLLIALTMTITGIANADAYKCRTPDGKITYAGQMSLTPGVKCEQMFVKKAPITQTEVPQPSEKPTPTIDPAKKAELSAADKELETKRKKTETDEAKKKSEKAAADKLAEQKIREDNCQNAKTNLLTYQQGGRITRINENGERVFLEEAEIQQKTEEAQKEIAKWCGT